MSKKAFGLNEDGIELALLEADGSTPSDSDYFKLGNVFRDTAVLNQEDDQEVECNCEEYDDPEEVNYITGKRVLSFSTSDLDPESCYNAFGGTLSEDNKKWNEPKTLPTRKVTVRFETRTGLKVAIASALLRSKFNWQIGAANYGLLEHTLAVVAPAGTDHGPLSIEKE